MYIKKCTSLISHVLLTLSVSGLMGCGKAEKPQPMNLPASTTPTATVPSSSVTVGSAPMTATKPSISIAQFKEYPITLNWDLEGDPKDIFTISVVPPNSTAEMVYMTVDCNSGSCFVYDESSTSIKPNFAFKLTTLNNINHFSFSDFDYPSFSSEGISIVQIMAKKSGLGARFTYNPSLATTN